MGVTVAALEERGLVIVVFGVSAGLSVLAGLASQLRGTRKERPTLDAKETVRSE